MLQHWDTYQRFNGRLFEERYKAYQGGHMEKDPSLGWFGGEIWFFDNYVLPCAVKLKKCGVFGVTYAEFVDVRVVANRYLMFLTMPSCVSSTARRTVDCGSKTGKQS